MTKGNFDLTELDSMLDHPMYTASGALRELHLLTPILLATVHWLLPSSKLLSHDPPDKSDGLKFDASKPATTLALT